MPRTMSTYPPPGNSDFWEDASSIKKFMDAPESSHDVELLFSKQKEYVKEGSYLSSGKFALLERLVELVPPYGPLLQFNRRKVATDVIHYIRDDLCDCWQLLEFIKIASLNWVHSQMSEDDDEKDSCLRIEYFGQWVIDFNKGITEQTSDIDVLKTMALLLSHTIYMLVDPSIIGGLLMRIKEHDLLLFTHMIVCPSTVPKQLLSFSDDCRKIVE